MRRLAAGGRIDRGRWLGLRFDGRRVEAHPGDTLASALLAAGVMTVGRSFKYHRPRGVLAAGSEEPSALVTVGEGAAAAPNVKATVQEVFDGLSARSQNRWPSLGLDLGAVNGLAAPFIGAGFYYKTFMWPAAFWERVYEPLIRRAAGLGRLAGVPAPDRSEKAFAFCDLLVIGAGPAGLMAALVAGRAGARVILADEDFAPGGRLNAERIEVGGQAGADWAAAAWAELARLANVRLMPRTAVTGVHDGGTFAALERVGEHLAAPPETLPRACFWRIVAGRAVLAAGATERLISFPGNDRPGVMLAGAVRAYLNRWAVAPRRAVVFTACDNGWRTAADLAAAGVEVVALIDARRDAVPPPGPWRVLAGAEVVGTRGRGALSEISVRQGGRVERLAVDCLAVSGGWNPNLQLTCHLGARPVWDAGLAAFVPTPRAVPAMAVAGAAAGGFSTATALRQGAEAAAEALGLAAPEVPEAEDRKGAAAAFWFVEAKGRAFVDLQNDVTVRDLRLAVGEGFGRAEHAKRYTTLGMATDQGRTGGVVGSGVIAALTGRGVGETGVTTARPPFAPVPIAAMGAGAEGPGLAPRRLHAGAWGRGGDGGPLRRGRALAARRAFPATGRGRGGGDAARVGDGACGGRGLRRLDARQDRGLRAGRGRVPRPGLCQHGLDAGRGPGALRRDAARGRLRAGRRHRGAARAAVPREHDHRGGGRGAEPSRVLRRVPVAGTRGRDRAGQRAVGAGGGRRAEGARGGRGGGAGRRGAAVSRLRRGRGRRGAGAVRSASPSRASSASSWRCRRATARRCSSGWWRWRGRSAAGRTGSRRSRCSGSRRGC